MHELRILVERIFLTNDRLMYILQHLLRFPFHKVEWLNKALAKEESFRVKRSRERSYNAFDSDMQTTRNNVNYTTHYDYLLSDLNNITGNGMNDCTRDLIDEIVESIHVLVISKIGIRVIVRPDYLPQLHLFADTCDLPIDTAMFLDDEIQELRTMFEISHAHIWEKIEVCSDNMSTIYTAQPSCNEYFADVSWKLYYIACLCIGAVKSAKSFNIIDPTRTVICAALYRYIRCHASHKDTSQELLRGLSLLVKNLC